MNDIINFRKMITPIIIQALFWLGVVGCIVYGIGMMQVSFLLGLVTMVAGVIMVRVYCELLILLFKMNDTLSEIRDNTRR